MPELLILIVVLAVAAVAVRWALHTDVSQQPPARRELDLR